MQSYLTENVIVMTIVTFAYFMTAFHEGLHFSWLPHIYLWISQIVTFFINILLFSLIPPYAWFNATVIQSWKIHGYDYSWTNFYCHISSRFKQSSFFRHLVEEFRTASSNHNWFLIDSLLVVCVIPASRIWNRIETSKAIIFIVLWWCWTPAFLLVFGNNRRKETRDCLIFVWRFYAVFLI